MNATATLPEGVAPSTNEDHAIDGLVDSLEVRFANPHDHDALVELSERSGHRLPSGGLMVAELYGELVAAISTTTREAIAERDAAGDAASTVLRYTVSDMHRTRPRPRRTGTPS